MTSTQVATPAAVEIGDTPQAQEARWVAWKAKSAAADRITQRRTRIAFTAIVIAFAGATLAMML